MSRTEKITRIVAIAIPVLILALYAIFLTHKINLVTADLGRHIKNGEILLENARILTHNFYSFTTPDFPTLNHHWASGLLFFGFWKSFGFNGVELLFIAISLITLWLFVKSIKRDDNMGLIGLISIPVIFLLAQRTEIRPEAFSYFFIALFFFLLIRFRDNPQDQKYSRLIYLIPLLEIIWANLHIYFILGPVVVGTFFVESWFSHRNITKKLFIILIFAFLATLVTPFGIKGIVEVVTIFNNYGYMLAENQSVWFLYKFPGPHVNLLLFQLGFYITALSFLVPIFRKEWRKIEISSILFFLGFGGMAWFAERNFALFGFFMIPIVVSNLRGFLGSFVQQERRVFEILTTVLLAMVILLALFGGMTKYFPYWRSGGFGLEEENSSAGEFWKQNGLKGPIFNNYDIGGYLIFHFYPEEKVFVDNRPEAYPAEFFQKVYIPMQENVVDWKEQLDKYKFNAIVFSHTDMTPWGQQFLVSRAKDPQWIPVFLDRYIIIFLRQNDENKTIIDKYRINLKS